MDANQDQKMRSVKERAKNWLIAIIAIAFLVQGTYSMFIKHNNEVGFLGMDKVGRQVFIQTLDGYLYPNIKVDSEFFDHALPVRLVLGDPLRTTIRFDIQDDIEFQATQSNAGAFLAQPASFITSQYQGKITMQNAYEVSPEDLAKTMKEKNVSTVEDLLSGFGFEKFELFSRGTLIKSIQLPRTKNVIHIGGD